MTILLEEKPPLDELVHYGVKGMKWGVRRSDAQLAASRKGKEGPSRREKRKARDAEIKSARERQAERYGEAVKAEMALYKSMVTGGRKEAMSQLVQANNAYNNSPDAKTAARMTTGEKVMNGVLLGGVGALAVYSVAGNMALNKLSQPAPREPANQLGSLARAKKNRKGVYNVTTKR